MTVRFYAPVHAETADIYHGTRRLTRTTAADGVRYERGTEYTPVAGGLDDAGRSYIDAEIRGAS